MQCRFCQLVFEEVTLENDHCFLLQWPQPVLIGSGLIIPKAHRETPFELTEEEWISTFDLLHRTKALVDRQYAPDGYNVGWNCGGVAGQSIFHAHWHVIPRYQDEPFAGRGIRYWLKQEDNKRP